MDPKRWGPTFWWFLHWMAHEVDATITSMRQHGLVEKTATNFQTTLLKSFIQFVERLGVHLLPCHTCQKSTRVFLSIVPGKGVLKKFSTQFIPSASDWIFELHNMVNIKLSKPPFTVDQFTALRNSISFQNANLLQMWSFVRQSVENCLHKWPQRRRLFEQLVINLKQIFTQLRYLDAYNTLSTEQRKHVNLIIA